MSAASDLPGSSDGTPAGSSVKDPLGPQVKASDDADKPDASARLAATRERLRRAMAPPPPATGRARSDRAPGTSAGSSLPFSQSAVVETVRAWLRNLRALPAAEVVGDAVTTWWNAHPLHTAGAMAADASKGYVQPYARRHPLGLVVGAAVVGALFFLTRPWRWALRPVLLAGLLPQIVSHGLRRAPVGTWLKIATLFARQQAASKRPRKAAGVPRAAAAESASQPTFKPHPATQPAGS